jgi:hypothetical protein
VIDPSIWLDQNYRVIPENLELVQNFMAARLALNETSPAYMMAMNQSRTRISNVPSDFASAAGRELSLLGLIAYDATYAFAYAWHRAIEVDYRMTFSHIFIILNLNLMRL